MILNALQIKILLAILAVLVLMATWEVNRDQPVEMDPVIVNKLSHAAVPTKPWLVP